MCNINQIRENIIDVIYENKQKSFTKKNLIKSIQLNKKYYSRFRLAYKNICESNIGFKKDYKLTAYKKYHIGYIQFFNNKDHYIFYKGQKYLVPNKYLNNAIHGDKVVFEIIDPYLLTAKIISVVKRKENKLTGTIVEYNNIPFLIPDNSKYNDIFISKNDINAKCYDKVMVKIDPYKIFGKPECSVIKKILEFNNQKEENFLGNIITKYKINNVFPGDVLTKASLLNIDSIKPNMFLNRVDLRNENIFTIDGKDAKDFDDAVSIEKKCDYYELGVYISDVTYYVREGGIIDKEAFKRGTSYYLQDYVIPMIPPSLSNGVCSLKEGKDRLCVGVKMKIDFSGNIINKDIFECVINSKRRFTYEEINDWSFAEKDKDLVQNITWGLELAKILNKKRNDRGYLDFNFSEIGFKKNDNGDIIDFYPYKKGPANKMIEEFMICTNETIAQTVLDTNHPFLYRIHGHPDKGKMAYFLKICHDNGINVSSVDPENITGVEINKILKNVNDENLKKCLNMNLITTMKQAQYSDRPLGHFGLASNIYCHFTSPIRRYPDIFAQRIVKKYIHKTINNDITIELYSRIVKDLARHCCFTERNEDMAESELDTVTVTKYMARNIDDVYSGLVYLTDGGGYYVLVKDAVIGYVHDIDKANIGDTVNIKYKEYNVKRNLLIFKKV